MAKVTGSNPTGSSRKKIRPALTPEARELQLASLAMDLVEQRLIDGTASSQETTTLIKFATARAQLEREKLKHENELLEAKKKAIESTARSEELFNRAIEAMQLYSGRGGSNEDEFEDY